MLKKRKRLSAQSTLEYAVLIVLVAVALLATQTYIKRAMQGRLRSAAEDIGEQFSPGASRVVTKSDQTSYTNETNLGGVTTSTLLADETAVRNVTTNIEGFNSDCEYWGIAGNAAAGCGPAIVTTF